MNASPILSCGSTLVVFDGPQRLTWSDTAPGHATPVSLWPSEEEAERVLAHLHDGGGLLVLVEEEESRVAMFAEEAARAPAALLPRVSCDGDLAELRITALDWLPAPLRERGRQFLADVSHLIQRQPDLLLPYLLLEAPTAAPCNLRFARLRRPRPFSTDRLRSTTEHLFPPQPAGGSGPLGLQSQQHLLESAS